MKIIPVHSKTYGYREIFVDDEDFELVSKYTWSVFKNYNTFYARNSKNNIILHRLILEVKDSKIFVDHIDYNDLNNQRKNIRTCTCAQNMNNLRPRGTSKYLGVHLDIRKYKKKDGSISLYYRWGASIKFNGKQKNLGFFNIKNEEGAAKAYDKAAKIHHKEFANLNFKDLNVPDFVPPE